MRANEIVMIPPGARGGTVAADGATVVLDDGEEIVVIEHWLRDVDGTRIELRPGDRIIAARVPKVVAVPRPKGSA
jgi:hypothetical protein